MKTNTTHPTFQAILDSCLFRTIGPRIDLPKAIMDLVSAIEAEDPESDEWLYWGEGHETTASDLVVGAYWAMTEWHGGQNSPEYAALSALGRIYRPGPLCGSPGEEDPEWSAYDAINTYYQIRAENGALS